MSEIVDELSRRASAGYVAERAKEGAVRKTSEWRDKASRNPATMGVIGGAIGAAVGTAMGKRFMGSEHHGQEGYDLRRRGEDYVSEYGRGSYERGIDVGEQRAYVPAGEGYLGEGGYAESGDTYGGASSGESARERVEGAKESARQRAGEVKERAKEGLESARGRASESYQGARERVSDTIEEAKTRASSARGRLPSSYEARERASSWYNRMLDQQPLLLAIGAIGAGFLASLLLPETEPERRAIGGMKERAHEGLESAGRKLEETISGDGSAEEHAEEEPSPSLTPPPTIPTY